MSKMITFEKERFKKQFEKACTEKGKSVNQIAYAVLDGSSSKESKRRIFRNYLSKGAMPEDILERVGEELNVAPESLTGATSILLDDTLLPYSFHLYQKLSLKQVMRDWMVFTGNGEIALTSEQWNQLYIGLREYTENYLKSIGK